MLNVMKIMMTDKIYPQKLKQIKNPPKQIFAIRKYRTSK